MAQSSRLLEPERQLEVPEPEITVSIDETPNQGCPTRCIPESRAIRPPISAIAVSAAAQGVGYSAYRSATASRPPRPLPRTGGENSCLDRISCAWQFTTATNLRRTATDVWFRTIRRFPAGPPRTRPARPQRTSPGAARCPPESPARPPPAPANARRGAPAPKWSPVP